MLLGVELTWGQALVRLAVAAALGGAIGLERELDEKAAGLRTHMLVSVGSALFTLVGAYVFGEFPAIRVDPTRIAAQVVTGVGFLGAGLIFRQGFTVRGLTTAASLWATSAVGMAAGAGEYVLAIVAGVIILVSLWPINLLAERLHGTNLPEVQLRLSLTRVEALGEVSAALANGKVDIGAIQTQRLGKDSYRADLAIRGRSTTAIASVLEVIDEIPGVEIVSTSQAD